jgi:hypothetical protein
MKPFFVVDLDEVCADFVDAACRVHGRSVDTVLSWLFYEEQWGITSEEFWGKIHDLGDSFYADWVKPKPWMNELLDVIRRTGDFVIMSSPGIGKPVDYAAKRIWIDKYIPDAKLIVGSEKHLLAAPNRMLIDDNETTCDKFAAAGGNVHLMAYPWNRNRGCVNERLFLLYSAISKFQWECLA